MTGESALRWVAVIGLLLLGLWMQIKFRTVNCALCGDEIREQDASWIDEDTPICDNCRRTIGDAS